MRKNIHWVVFFCATAILLALDLWLKDWAVQNLRGQPSIVLLNGVLGLRYHENTGALFGFLSNARHAQWILSVMKIIVLMLILLYYHRLPRENKFWFVRVPIILFFAGGLGNLVDRLVFGHVRDMLEFLFIDFAIFNLADVYVTAGVFSLLFVVFFIVRDFPFP